MKSSYSLDSRRSRREVEISMTPMIDVIFLLLVFFIATSSFRVIEKMLPSGVSEMQPSVGASDSPPPEITPADLEQIIVRLALDENQQTQATLNGQRVSDLPELQVRLQAIAKVGSGVPVIIDPEKSIAAKQVIRVYDWARSAGLTSVYLATRN